MIMKICPAPNMEYGEGVPCSACEWAKFDLWAERPRLPVITVYLVRARAAARRPPPPRAQSRFRWREVRPAASCVRSALRVRKSSEPSSASASEPRPLTSRRRGRALGAATPPLPCAGPEPPARLIMPRVKPACVRRVSIGTYYSSSTIFPSTSYTAKLL